MLEKRETERRALDDKKHAEEARETLPCPSSQPDGIASEPGSNALHVHSAGRFPHAPKQAAQDAARSVPGARQKVVAQRGVTCLHRRRRVGLEARMYYKLNWENERQTVVCSFPFFRFWTFVWR